VDASQSSPDLGFLYAALGRDRHAVRDLWRSRSPVFDDQPVGPMPLDGISPSLAADLVLSGGTLLGTIEEFAWALPRVAEVFVAGLLDDYEEEKLLLKVEALASRNPARGFGTNGYDARDVALAAITTPPSAIRATYPLVLLRRMRGHGASAGRRVSSTKPWGPLLWVLSAAEVGVVECLAGRLMDADDDAVFAHLEAALRGADLQYPTMPDTLPWTEWAPGETPRHSVEAVMWLLGPDCLRVRLDVARALANAPRKQGIVSAVEHTWGLS